MGAFFTSVHVRGHDVGPVLEALRADARARELDEVEDGAEADCAVMVAAPDARGWISIYDEVAEAQDLDDLERIAAAVSPGTHAFTVLVHDSDLLDVRLFSNGRRADRFEIGAGAKRYRGRPAAWSALVDDVDALAELIARRDRWAESVLEELGRLLRCDPSRISTGFRYLRSGDSPEVEIARTLRFRSRERSATEAGASGPPALDLRASVRDSMELSVGDELRIGIGGTSVGGPGRGVELLVWGEAIDRELVEIQSFALVVGRPSAGGGCEVLVPRRERSQDGGVLLVAEKPELAIPAGLADPSAAMTRNPLAFVDAQYARMVYVNVFGRVVAPGTGSVGCAIVPVENRDGAVAAETTLEIDPPMWRPLRARADAHRGGNVSALWRPLAGDSHRALLVSVDGPRTEISDIARDVILRLASVMATPHVETMTFAMSEERVPKTGRGAPKSLLTGKRLLSLVAAMSSEMSVEVCAFAGPRVPGRLQPVWRVAVGLGILPRDVERLVPTLHVVVDLSAVAEQQRADVTSLLEEALERAIACGALGGAIRTMGPPGGRGVGQSAYESACGVEGQMTTSRSWCSRWLRMPGELTWLGPTLVPHLQRAALVAAGALVEERNGGWLVRVERARDHTFEQALAPVLPGEDEAREAAQSWFSAAPR